MVLSTKVIINYVSYAVIGLLAVPTLLIMVTWNYLPGSGLYPVKRGLERIALALVNPSLEVTATLRAKLIDRRFDEASTLLVQSSQTLGFSEFDSEVQSAKEDILKKAQDENSDERVVEQQINDLLTQLEKYNLELEAQKQTYIAYNPLVYGTPEPTTSTIIIPSKTGFQPAQTITYNAPVPNQQTQQPQTRTVSPAIVINQVNQSQGNLNSTIEQLRREQERLQQEILAQQLRLQREQEDRIRQQQANQSPTPAASHQNAQPQPSQQPSQQPSSQPSQEPEIGRTGLGSGNAQAEETPPPQPPSQAPSQMAPLSMPSESSAPPPPASQAPAEPEQPQPSAEAKP